MRIVIDARIIYTSTGRYVERLLHYLQSLDHDNDYVVLLWKRDFERWQSSAPNFTKVVADHPSYSFGEQLQFARQLTRLKADLVHFTMPQFPLAYRGRFVVTIHDLTLVDFINRRSENALKNFYKQVVKPRVFKTAIKQAAQRAEYVITPTDYVREQVVSRLGARDDRVVTTYEAADPMAATPEPYTPLVGKTFLLYVGNAYPYKNLTRLIDAFGLLKRSDLELVLVGKTDSFYDDLARYAKKRGIEGVRFTGFVPDAQLAWLYMNAATYVFPSLSEGFGLPGLEAMTYALPVVAAKATSLPEVYGQAALYFDPLDPSDLAAKIGEVLGDPKLRSKLRTAGLARLNDFSWSRMAKQTLEIYQRALNSV